MPLILVCALLVSVLGWAAEPTLATVTTAAQAAVETGTLRWTAPQDLDRDGRISRFEILVAGARSDGWLRRALPEQFELIDRDRDRRLSQAELAAVAARETAAIITVAPRRRLLMGGRAAGAAAPANGLSVGSASVMFGGQQAYIADYNVVNGQYDPVIGHLTWGTSLEVSDVTITIRRK